MTFALFVQHVDEAVNSQLKDRYQDKMTRLQKGEKKVYEDMFAYACPKFISPIPPDYDSLPENYNKVRGWIYMYAASLTPLCPFRAFWCCMII
jgi:translation initiation factor 3 subunit L